jgi:hypothetical protein
MGVRIPNLDLISQRDPMLGEALQEFVNLHDNLGQKISVNPQGKTLTPPPHVALEVTAANGVLHASVDNGNNPRTRNLHNFVEWDTNPNFSNAQTESLHVGTQRRIPTFLGKTVYLRSYTMYADGEQQSAYKYAQIHDKSPSFVTSATGTGVTSTTATITGPTPPPTRGSGTSPVPGRGYGVEKFVSSPTSPGKPPKVFE